MVWLNVTVRHDLLSGRTASCFPAHQKGRQGSETIWSTKIRKRRHKEAVRKDMTSTLGQRKGRAPPAIHHVIMRLCNAKGVVVVVGVSQWWVGVVVRGSSTTTTMTMQT